MGTPVIQALVVDDSALYRKFVASVLKEIPEVEVIGTASNGRIALEKIKSLKPDFITLDLEMPELDGLGLLRELSLLNMELPTVMISSLTADGAKATNTALQLGAFDFVLKPVGKSPEESRKQLRKDLAPKIQASLSTLRRKQRANRSRSTNESHPAATRPKIQNKSATAGVVRPQPEIVGIGVSTGGPVALNKVLPGLPADFPCPILLVQHMPPLFTKSLADDLNRICPIEVLEAADGMVAKPGQVLIAPGGSQMKIAKINREPVVQITDDAPERSCKPSVDYLFRSIAHHYGNRAVGTILTGMGDDGTVGCQLMKNKGALIVAQDEASCVVYGMPRSVAEAGLVDQVVPLNDIATCLTKSAGQGILT